MTVHRELPGAVPYVLRQGEGLSHAVAGQVVRTLAGVEQTAGGFGAVEVDCPLDHNPIPMHWHEREHDTWFVTRGRLQVWCGERSTILGCGDFAYVRPRDIHSYRSVAPRTRFFGVVAPGGWERFFADAGEVWETAALPSADQPFDFSRMGPAMAKHRIMRVEDPVYVQATPLGEGDRAAPGKQASFFLEAGFGRRHLLQASLVTTLLSASETEGLFEMRMVEGCRGAALPILLHRATHVLLYVLDGTIELTLDSKTQHLVGGDAANVPAGIAYTIKVVSGTARWLATSSGGNGGAYLERAGAHATGFSPLRVPAATERPATASRPDLDIVIV